MWNRRKASPQNFQLERRIRHLLVDLDGTILGNDGLPLSLDFVRQALKKASPRTLLGIYKAFRNPSATRTNDERVVDFFSKKMNLSPDDSRQTIKDAVSGIFPSLQKHFYPIPEAQDFLRWAKDHFELTLATNPVWPVEIVEMRVQWAGIDPRLFKRITHVKLMRASKPNPDYYKQVLELVAAPPQECLLIGNDLKMDLPATRVGIPVYIVNDSDTVEKLAPRGAEAPAWSGSFAKLKTALQNNLTSQD